MKLLLIRHAEPNYKLDTITPKGEIQAELLSKYLKNIHIDDIYSSPLGRARKTASYTAEFKKIKPVILDWAEEVDGDYIEGQYACWADHGKDTLQNPKVLDYNQWHKYVEFGKHMRPLVKETYNNFIEFIKQYGLILDKLVFNVDKNIFKEKTIVIFCHEGFIKTLLSSLLHYPLPIIISHTTISHASITDIRFENIDSCCVPKADVINLTSYLGDLKTGGYY